MTARLRKNLIRIIVSLAAFAAVFSVDKAVGLDTVIRGRCGFLLPFALYGVVYIAIGYDVLFRAARNIVHGQVFDENFLMCVATLGSIALAIYGGVTGRGAEGFDEACAVLLFYQVGEWFQSYATGRSRKSVAALMDIRPDYANVERNGVLERVDPSEVEVGETITVAPGERVPLDGVIVSGATALDTKALTGESLPREAGVGDEIVSGSVNLTTQVRVRVEKKFYDSTVSKILELVENASARKSKAENFITKFARIYTPAVVGTALVLAILPSIITGDWLVWVYRALSFLVVSCPCALVISIPMSFFVGIGVASRYGILVKGSNYLEKIDKANIFVFDKTGTLTKGNFAVTDVFPKEKRDEVLRLAAIAEQASSHPIGKSIVTAYAGELPAGYVLTDVAGAGIIARRGDDEILCGNAKLMTEHGIAYENISGAGSCVYVAHCGEYVGAALVSDEIKPETQDVIAELNGYGKTIMLTGDNATVAKSVAEWSGVTEFFAEMLPQNKVEKAEELIAAKARGDVLCFTGDGINDAPVLMRADVGIAMGGVGSDAAIEAADIVLMHDDLNGLPLCKRIARKTMNIVKQNIVFSIAVKLAILVLAACGIANMWLAIFGDVGVAVIAILNAMRVNTVKQGQPRRKREKSR